MKSNYVKSLLIALGTAVAFTMGNNANAFTLSQIANQMNGVNYIDMCSNGYRGYYNSYSQADGSGHIYLNNFDYVCNGEMFPYTYFSYDWSRNANVYIDSQLINYGGHQFVMGFDGGKRGYSYVQARNNGSQVAFMLWSPRWADWQTYISTAYDYYTQTINGESVDFDNVLLRHDTFVLFKEDNGRYLTKQYIGDYVLDNYILYVDIADGNRNVWLIDLYNMKAWSTYYDMKLASQLMFGLIPRDDIYEGTYQILTLDYLDDIEWTQGYTVSLGGDKTFPSTAGNTTNQQSFISFNYVQDANWQQPSLTDDEEEHFSAGTGTNTALDEYNQCKAKYVNLKTLANSEYLCRQQIGAGTFTTGSFASLLTSLLYASGFNDTGYDYNLNDYPFACGEWIYYSYLLYGDTYSGNLTEYKKDFKIADNSSLVANGLNVDDYCSYNTTQNQDCNVSWTDCAWAIGDTKLKYLCSECSFYSSGFNVVDEINNGVGQWALNNVFLPPWNIMSGHYHSGYNEVIGLFNINKCESDILGKSYTYIDIVVYGVIAVFFFLLIKIL